jgi:archaellin
MEKLVIIYADVVHSETLPPVEGWFGDPPQGSWGILRVENEVGKPNNRLEYNERCVLRVNPRVPIVPGQLISIIVKPSEGSPVTLRRVAPSTIVKENILSTL